MKNIYHKFLIVSTIAIFFGGAYTYFLKDLNSENIIPVAFGSSLSSSNGTGLVSTVASLGDKVSSDISFLTSLVSLRKITIDTSLFTNPAFSSLKDNSVRIEPISPGRINPFSPIDNSLVGNNFNSAKIITDAPTQITTNSVTLNGTVSNLSGVTDTYFEYGITNNLGTVTSIVKQSLVGTFIKNVSGLTPKTTYFSRACAKINGTTLCGEVVSFTTN